MNDANRTPWLSALRDRMDEALAKGENVILACSALKHKYQDYLEQHDPAHIEYVYLHGSEELLRKRLESRKGHFMPPGLLHSQFEALKPPKNSLQVEVSGTPEAAADEIRTKLKL